MANEPVAEVWLRGPIADIPGWLQPVAHSLLQCREELRGSIPGLTPEQIWARPSGVASVGFHVRHAAGSLDRLFTYARGERLSAAQLGALAAESNPDLTADAGTHLVRAFDQAIDAALEQLRTDEASPPSGAARRRTGAPTLDGAGVAVPCGRAHAAAGRPGCDDPEGDPT